jgi:hypothetical protein
MIHHNLNELDDAITRYHEALSILPLDTSVIELLNLALATNATLDPLSSSAFTSTANSQQTTNAQVFIAAGNGGPKRVPAGLSLPPAAVKARINPSRVGTNPSWEKNMTAAQKKFEGRPDLSPNPMDGQGPAYRHMQIVGRTVGLPAFVSSALAGPSRNNAERNVRAGARENEEADAERVMQEVSMDVGDESMDVED